MSDMFICKTHGIGFPASGRGCELCYGEWELRRDAAEMPPEERVAELERWVGQVSIPVACIFQRIDELVGRPVFPHEIGLAFDQLREEAHSRSGVLDIDQVIARAELSGKPVVVVRET